MRGRLGPPVHASPRARSARCRSVTPASARRRSRRYYDIEDDRRYLEYELAHRRIVDCGDSDIIYTNVKRTFDNITRDVKQILRAGAFPVVIGATTPSHTPSSEPTRNDSMSCISMRI